MRDAVEGLPECFWAPTEGVSDLKGWCRHPMTQQKDPAAGAWDHSFAPLFLGVFHDQDEVCGERHGWGDLSAPMAG